MYLCYFIQNTQTNVYIEIFKELKRMLLTKSLEKTDGIVMINRMMLNDARNIVCMCACRRFKQSHEYFLYV